MRTAVRNNFHNAKAACDSSNSNRRRWRQVNKEDANAHDILLCVKDGEKQATPIGRGRGYRYGLPNQEYYFKSQQEMKALFSDLPEAILNIQEVLDKIEDYRLTRSVVLPNFEIPPEFLDPMDADGGKRGENAYLKYLTYEGAKNRYENITPEIEERLEAAGLELETPVDPTTPAGPGSLTLVDPDGNAILIDQFF